MTLQKNPSKNKKDDVREAEYVLLRMLAALDEESGFNEIKRKIADLASKLDEKNMKSPIRFAHVHGPNKLHSRAFLQALNRCRDINAIHEDRGELRLTTFGNEIIERRQDELPRQFVDTVEQKISSQNYRSK